MKKKHLVLIGGGHAHMVTLANIHAIVAMGHRITVIGPSAHHYYSGMGPGMLSRIYSLDEIRFATEQVVTKQGGTFLLDKAISIDPVNSLITLQSGTSVTYDVLSCNAGSYIPWPETIRGEDIFTVKPIERLHVAQQRILTLCAERSITIAVVGGGPSALEVAGNIWRLASDYGKHAPTIRILAGRKLMANHPEKIRRLARRSLTRRQIDIVESGYVDNIQNHQVFLESGETVEADIIFLAVGVKPSRIFADSGLPTGPDGGLLVNRYLQCIGHPEIFGGGDCIYFQDNPLDKVGVYAVRENPVIYHNLVATMENRPLQPFNPGGTYLLVYNLGDGTGILKKNRFIFSGRLAFHIKNYIDTKFMKKFQAIE